ncbi:hypothetical protein ACFE04_024502 [Oxalis oulophora]
MDFHSLKRRQLQILCKKNKILANLTNIAMADALDALRNVEGLEEFFNQHDSIPSRDSEHLVPEPPLISHTKTRTSTQRKPLKASTQSSKPLARTTRSVRNLVTADFPLENKDANIPSTPALQSGYNTRRSVRFLEKSMEQLSLKEKGRTEPMKMDVFADDVEDKKDEIMTEVNNDDNEHCISKFEGVETEVVTEKNVDMTIVKYEDEELNSCDDGKVKTSDDHNCESGVLVNENIIKAMERNDASIDEKVAENTSKAGEIEDLESEEFNMNIDEGIEKECSPARDFANVPKVENSVIDDDDIVMPEDRHVNENSLSELCIEEVSIEKELSDKDPSENERKEDSHASDFDNVHEVDKLVSDDPDVVLPEEDNHVEIPQLQFSRKKLRDGNGELSAEDPSENDKNNESKNDEEEVKQNLVAGTEQWKTESDLSDEENERENGDFVNEQMVNEGSNIATKLETDIDEEEEVKQNLMAGEEQWETVSELSDEENVNDDFVNEQMVGEDVNIITKPEMETNEENLVAGEEQWETVSEFSDEENANDEFVNEKMVCEDANIATKPEMETDEKEVKQNIVAGEEQ